MDYIGTVVVRLKVPLAFKQSADDTEEEKYHAERAEEMKRAEKDVDHSMREKLKDMEVLSVDFEVIEKC